MNTVNTDTAQSQRRLSYRIKKNVFKINHKCINITKFFNLHGFYSLSILVFNYELIFMVSGNN